MSYKWKEMTEQKEVGFCENCVNILTSDKNLEQVIYHEEKKAEVENNAKDKKKKGNNCSFISYL